MTFTYCPDCGKKLIPRTLGDEGDVPFCESCNRPFFPVFSTCVICLCVNELGDNKVFFKEAFLQNGEVDGIGTDWHPTESTHKKLAAYLLEFIRKNSLI